MQLLAAQSARGRCRTLVAQKDGGVWIWPGILLTLRRGGEIVPAADEVLRFWISRLHGPEAIDRDLLSKLSRAAWFLTIGEESKAQDALDALDLFALSRDGAALMKVLARECDVETLDLPVCDGPRRWDAGDLSEHIVFFKEAVLASRPLAKGTFPVFDPAKHPRWPKGTEGSVGGQFAPGDGAGAARPQLVADDEPPREPRGVLPAPGETPLDPKGLNEAPPTPEEQLSIARTLQIIDSGTDEELAALHPHPYQNRPHQVTGAVLPPSNEGYVTFDVPSDSIDRGKGRIIIDSGTGAIYYTNKHYLSFYNVTPTGQK